MAPFSLCAHMVTPQSLRVSSSPLIEETCMTSLYLNYDFQGAVSKYRHIVRYWGLGLQHRTWEGRHDLAHNTTFASLYMDAQIHFFCNQQVLILVSFVRDGCADTQM